MREQHAVRAVPCLCKINTSVAFISRRRQLVQCLSVHERLPPVFRELGRVQQEADGGHFIPL